MQMTESEIVRSYKNAETPRKQIKILAELNCCDRSVIREILVKHGCELPATGNRYTGKLKKEAAPTACQPAEPVDVWEESAAIPKEVVNVISAEIEALNRDIEDAETGIDLIKANIDQMEHTRQTLIDFIKGQKDETD